MKLFSTIISWLFLPLVMPLLALIIVMYTPAEQDFTSFHGVFHINDQNKIFFLINFTLYSLVAPGISILILRASRIIGTIEMDDRRDRIVPLLLVAGYSLILIYRIMELKDDAIVSSHFLGLAYAGLAMSLVFVAINLKTKISLHAGGAGMLVGFVLAYYLEQSLFTTWPIYVIVMVAGLILMARIYLQKHTPFQAYLGFVLGSLITFSADYLCCHIWI